MKTSLICTVLNEEKTIGNLLDSILGQTRKPDEIVIVDGGSVDGTINVLRKYAKKLPIRIVSAYGANIAQGRNIAIKHAKNPVIVSTDGGTTHDKDWFKNIVKNIEKGYDISSGMFYPLPKTKFEELVGRLFYPNMDKVPDDWPPSSRSAAFTKKIWEKSGGYPEELYTAEDSIFNYRLRSVGAKYLAARDAKSHWRPRPNFNKFFKQYFTYAKGNGEALLAVNHYPECRMLYLFWGLAAAVIVSYLYYPSLLWVPIVFIPLVSLLKSFALFKDLIRTTSGAGLLIAAFVANVLGSHYGLFLKALGRVKVKKVRYIRTVK